MIKQNGNPLHFDKYTMVVINIKIADEVYLVQW